MAEKDLPNFEIFDGDEGPSRYTPVVKTPPTRLTCRTWWTSSVHQLFLTSAISIKCHSASYLSPSRFLFSYLMNPAR